MQQQVADRAAVPLCGSCHASFDSYGLVLDYYDNIGIYRTTDDLDMAVDAHTMLPAELGGAPVASAIDLAQKLSESPAFTNCMATSVLQYAMTTIDAHVDLPIDPTQSGCAAADVATKFNASSGKSLAEVTMQLVKAGLSDSLCAESIALATGAPPSSAGSIVCASTGMPRSSVVR